MSAVDKRSEAFVGPVRYDHYIDGKRTPSESGARFESRNPYTGEVWAELARGGAADVDRAVAVASAAFPAWARMKPSARGRLLTDIADLILRDAERLAEVEVRDNGKLLQEMSAQTRYIAEWFRYYGGLADKLEGSVIPTDKADIFNIRATNRSAWSA